MVRDRLAASPFAAEPRGARGADRRRQSALGPRRSRRAHLAAAGAHRPSARLRRLAGSGQRAGLRGCGRPAGLPAGGASRTLRTAANAAIDDRNGRLHGTGRTMAARKFLTLIIRTTNGRWRTGSFGAAMRLRARCCPCNQEANNDHQSEDPRHSRDEAAHHRVRRRRRRRQRGQQHDRGRACRASTSSSPTPTRRR